MLQTLMLRDRSTFTASTDLLEMSANRYVDELTLHWKVNNTGLTAVSVASALDLVNPLEVRLKGSPVVTIRGSDLYGFNLLALGHNPLSIVAGSSTSDQTKIMGLRVPVWQPPRPSGSLATRAVRAAVTNADTETLTLAEHSSDNVLKAGWLHYNELAITSAGSIGFGNRVPFPSVAGDGRLGRMVGLFAFSTTIPTATAETSSIQSIRLFVNDQQVSEREWHELAGCHKIGFHDLLASPADATILDNYRYWDMADDPLPAGVRVRIDFDTQVTSSATRFFPVFVV